MRISTVISKLPARVTFEISSSPKAQNCSADGYVTCRKELKLCQETGTFDSEENFTGFISGEVRLHLFGPHLPHLNRCYSLENEISPFLFKPISVTDDSLYENANADLLDSLGTIKLGVDRVFTKRKKSKPKKKKGKGKAKQPLDPISTTIHEDDRKAFHSHQVG